MTIISSSLLMVVMMSMFSDVCCIEKKNLRNLCEHGVFVDDDLLIYLIPWRQASCKVTLLPQSGDGLVARFTSYHYDIVRNTSGKCTYEYLQLASEEHFFNLTYDEGYCDTTKPSVQYDLGTKGYFRYRATDLALNTTMTADLMVTEIYNKQGSVAECDSGQFDCEINNYCISDQLTCNGYDNCGNGRDESGCGLSMPTIMGIVFACIFFVVLIVLIGICVAKQANH